MLKSLQAPFIAASIVAVAFAASINPMPQETTTLTVAATQAISLRYAINDAPPVIEATARALGLEPFGYLPPRLYTSWRDGVRYFDAEKAQRNLPEITAILNGKDLGQTDLEKTARRIVRDPDDYELEELTWAEDQFEGQMWPWFRGHFPALDLTEWNLSPAKDSTNFPRAEALIIRNLDAFDISLYWNDKPIWLSKRRQILRHAVALGREYDRPVVVTIWERMIEWNADRTVATYVPLTREAIDQVLGLVVAEAEPGVEIILVFWSNSFSILAANNPAKILAETVGQADDYDATAAVHGRIVSLMAAMEQAEAMRHR